MRHFSAIAALIFLIALVSFSSRGQDLWNIKSTGSGVDYDLTTGTGHGTNIFIQYKGVTLSADSGSFNQTTGDVQADGHVRIETGELLWAGDHIRYNFLTKQMHSEQFRTGRFPVFAEGRELSGDRSNNVYTARHVYVTTDDVGDPAIRVRAARITIVPKQYVEMWNALVFVDGVPMFYFPYYRRNLGPHANNMTVLPGYRSSYGPYLLATYRWYLGDVADGKIHADYRVRRGPGMGPDVNLHLGDWGNATAKYYYTHDEKPDLGTNGFPNFGNVPNDRQRFYLVYQGSPSTNLNLKALVNYQSDPFVLHDFFEGDYTANPQPNTFVEVNKYWNNWSVDAESTPRINGFFNQIERLPDVRITGYRQQIFDTPLYYESESSAGWYRSFVTYTNGVFPGTNGFYAASAARADTFHQVLLPWTFFNWLNVTPHVGGRFTYYSEENAAASGTNDETYRKVFNTGIGASFKLSQLWREATNSFLEIDGLRHVIEPSANYVYVPRPSTPARELPQFDSELPSLMLLPVDFPDYNNIDSIDSENVIRFGLRNTLQTKRDGQLDNFLDWNVLLDWRLRPDPGQNTFNDLYSKFSLRPKSWLTLDSQVRYDMNDGRLNMAFHQLTFSPDDHWSWGLGHWYLHSGFPVSTAPEDNFITSTMFYRVNDNWGLRATHNFNAQTGRLQEQFYTLYRDLRSWTSAITFRVIDNEFGPTDFTVAFAFSLKAAPSRHLGDDAVNPYQLVGE